MSLKCRVEVPYWLSLKCQNARRHADAYRLILDLAKIPACGS